MGGGGHGGGGDKIYESEVRNQDFLRKLDGEPIYEDTGYDFQSLVC